MSKLFIVLLVAVLAFSKRSGSSRSKRVINGYVPIVNKERTFEYEVVRYNVWIGAATTCLNHKTVPQDIPKWWILSNRGCLPDIDDQRCGGALIHPRIVQTAGHCVGSEVLTVDNPNEAWAPGRVWSVWEDMAQVFVGHTDIEDFQFPTFSRFFLLHPQYARLRNTEFNWVSHDYGWIILNSEPIKLEHWSNHVAPVPTVKALVDHTSRLLKKEEVCLFSGFGAWQYTDTEILNTTSSRYLRYGWQLTTGYTQCWWYLHVLTGADKSKWKWKYAKYATWFCHVPFGNHVTDHPGVGDSGSPVHCNGRMLALVSGGKWQRTTKSGKKRTHITRTMGLAFSIFENTADYRNYFVWTLKYYARVRIDVKPSLHFFKHPERRDINHHSTLIEYSTKSEGLLCANHVSHLYNHYTSGYQCSLRKWFAGHLKDYYGRKTLPSGYETLSARFTD